MTARVSFKRGADLLEEGVEASVTHRRIALLDVNLDLDRVLIVGVREAAERLARVTILQDDQTAIRDLFGQHAVALNDGIGQRPTSALSASSICSVRELVKSIFPPQDAAFGL